MFSDSILSAVGGAIRKPRRLPLLLIVALLPTAELAIPPLAAAPPPAEEGFHWVLVFEDEFHGDTLDSSKWSRGYPWGQTHNHKAYMAPRNVQVEDGKLVITAEAENHPSSPDSVDHDGHHIVDYTSGAIHSQGNFHTTHGYIEARLKLSAAQGAWPAFWTLQSGWPPEIDIMENLNGTDTFYTNYHWGTWQDHHSFFRTHQGNNLAGAFRTYGFDWTADHLSWYFQNNRIAHFTNANAIAESANHYLLLNLAVGGWPGDPDPADYPVTYEADWVRVWKQVPAPNRRVIGHWRLNERLPGPVADASGNTDGTLVNEPALGQPGPHGKHNYAFDFSGGMRGVNTNTSTIIPEAGDFTLSVMFRTEGAHEEQGHLFSNDPGQAKRASLQINEGYLRWLELSDRWSMESPDRVDDGEWHHAKVARSGNAWSLWLNGKVVATHETDVSIGQDSDWFIGRANDPRSPFEGLISEVKVLNYAARSTLLEHWKLNETAKDLAVLDPSFEPEEDRRTQAVLANAVESGSAALFVKGNSVENPSPLFGEASGSAVSTGSLGSQHNGARIELGDVGPGTGPFTIALWFRRIGETDPGTEHLLSSNIFPQSGRWNLMVAENAIRLFHNSPDEWGGDGANTHNLTNSFQNDRWYHVAMTRDADDTFGLYLDGKIVFSTTNSGAFTNSENGVWLGARPEGSSYFPGFFDDVRIYDSALPEPDIAKLAERHPGAPMESLPVTGAAFIEPKDVRLQWSLDGDTTSEYSFDVFFGEDTESLEIVTSMPAGEPLQWDAGDLEYNRSYYWRVSAETGIGILEGPVWSFSTKPFPIPGTVIDHSPKAAGRYVGSPSIVELPNGNYLASHDWFGPGTTFNETVLFESTDGGRSWRQIGSLAGQFWSNLFRHEGALYIMGTDGRYSRAVIRRSDDDGRTWTTPQDEDSGLLFPDDGYHTAPMPVVVHDGRIWRSMEDNRGGSSWGDWFRAFVMSAPVDADLLKASNWTTTNPLGHDSNYLDGQFGGWLEGNIVVDTEGTLVNIPRVDYRNVPEKAAIIRIGEGGQTATFDPDNDFITFPGGAKKFVIRHDPESGEYWTLSNAVLPQHEGGNVERTRNAVTLMSSEDLREWTTHDLVLYHPDVANHGFQYMDWQFAGDDLIAVSRTAYDDGMGGADNQHNANFMTFHRIENFRGPHRPFPDEHPRNRWAEEGGDAAFRASVTSGEPQWRWFREVPDGEDQEIQPSGRFSIASEGSGGTLRIRDIQTSDAGHYYAIAENEAGSFTFPAARLRIFEHALIHHWRLDDAADWSGGQAPLLNSANPGHDAKILAPEGERDLVRFGEPGAQSWTGSSIHFSGRYERVELGDVAPRDKPFTIAFWFKMNAFNAWDGNQDHILSSNGGPAQQGRWNMHLLADPTYLDEFGGPQLVFWQDGPGRHELTAVIEPDRWYHVTLARGPETENNFRIYLDGNLVHQGTNHLDFTNASRGVMLACRPTPTLSSAFDGWIDDVRFYDGVLRHLGELWGDGYAGWAREEFGEIYGTAGTRLGDDFNRDGVSNYANYLFGMNPRVSKARPSIGLDMTSGSEPPALNFTLRADLDIPYFLEISNDLLTWNRHAFGFGGDAWSFADGAETPGEITEPLREHGLSTLRVELHWKPTPPERGFFRIHALTPD